MIFAIDGIETFSSKILKNTPSHQLLTILTIQSTEIDRFLNSEPLTKLYVAQVLREKANLKFNNGDTQGALSLYNLVG